MLALLFAACAQPTPPTAREALAPPRPCPPIPDAVVAALGERKLAPPLAFGDEVASLGPDARCPVAFGPDGWTAAVVTAPPAAVVVRNWPDGPSEVGIERPLPVDGEGRIAGAASWLVPGSLGPLDGWTGPIAGVDLDRARVGPALEVRWCGLDGCGCSELLWGFDADLERVWACPGVAAPPLPLGPVPWPRAADVE